MKHLLTYLLLVVAMATSHPGHAQAGRIETFSGGVVSMISVLGNNTPNKTAHEFTLQVPNPDPATAGAEPNLYPRLLRVSNTGRMAVGNGVAEFPRSMLNVGTGNYAVSMDEVGSARRNIQNALIPGVAKGGACVGFNASRQPDADIACDANAAGSRNGGALIWAEDEGTLNFTAFPTNKGTQVTGTVGTQWYHPDDVASYRVMKIMPAATGQTAQPTGGRVQIGALAPTYHPDYRLAVDGKLVAQSIFVTQVANWADFVFAPTYELQPLPELEAYLKQNRHLPAIPSAAEVEKNGIDVGEMNARLLQSLEELTLHVIELGKQNARLQAEVAALAAKVNQAATPAASK